MKKKLKIKRSVTRRFKVTKTGKLRFDHQYNSHLKGKKSRSRIRRQKEPGIMTGAFEKKIKMLLGQG